MDHYIGKTAKGIDVERRGNLAILRFQDGSLNFYVTDGLKEKVKELIAIELEAGCDRFILNLELVKIIDSCGVGLIIVVNNVVMAASGKLYISNVRPFIIKIFEILRIARHLTILDTEDEAVAIAMGDDN